MFASIEDREADAAALSTLFAAMIKIPAVLTSQQLALAVRRMSRS